MNVGFETVGNATLICHDRKPILVTDPWIVGTAYFGSWTFSHDIPPQQLAAIQQCDYVWFSHGHPDHLSGDSLPLLMDKTVLLPDHVGGRIARDLEERGHHVRIMKDRVWYKISDRIHALCISDYNQDGILLLDINGRLVVNLNDSSDRGWGHFVARIIRRYRISFLMHLSGFGDADMINVWGNDGQRVPPPAAKRRAVGEQISLRMRRFSARYFIPFSSMHRYQRTDSGWANDYATKLTDYSRGFDHRFGKLLPAFIHYDCATDRYEEIRPPERPLELHEPEEFGDRWGDQLESCDRDKLRTYFQSIEHLSDHYDFINFRVGGKDNIIELSSRNFHRAITFEVPRQSLMTAIEFGIFDDLLIGNFMKTTLEGKFGKRGLYPDFTPYVAKYADNGLARSRDEVAEYFRQYRQRAPFDFLRARLEGVTKEVIRGSFEVNSPVYRFARRSYYAIRMA